MTSFGRYKFLRIPYGISTGSEVIQRCMGQLFSGQPHEIVIDDILIWVSSVEEHNKSLKCVSEPSICSSLCVKMRNGVGQQHCYSGQAQITSDKPTCPTVFLCAQASDIVCWCFAARSRCSLCSGWHACAFPSRALTDTEAHYAQIEK